MVLEGVVTDVTNFGAIVDVGVHQGGLMHVFALAERYVHDLREVVKAGDIVRVKVLEVDLQRRRIALTMRLGNAVAAAPDQAGPPQKLAISQHWTRSGRARAVAARPSRRVIPGR